MLCVGVPFYWHDDGRRQWANPNDPVPAQPAPAAVAPAAQPAPAPAAQPAAVPAAQPAAVPAAQPAPAKPSKPSRPAGHMVVANKYLAVQHIKSGSVLQFEHNRVNTGLRGGAPKGAVWMALSTRRTELEAALVSVQEQVVSGALSQEQYVEGVQKLHKVHTGLLKKGMLTGDDAAVAQLWVPIIEEELTEAGVVL